MLLVLLVMGTILLAVLAAGVMLFARQFIRSPIGSRERQIFIGSLAAAVVFAIVSGLLCARETREGSIGLALSLFSLVAGWFAPELFRSLGGYFADVLRGVSRGTGRAIERVMPWFLGGIAIFASLTLFPAMLELVLAMGVMVFGFRYLFRGLLPKSGGKRR